MATNLIDVIKSYFTPDVIGRAASYVGESEAATQKALSAIAPTLVGALANLGGTADGAQHVGRILEAGSYDGSSLSNVGSLFTGGRVTQEGLSAGKGILDTLFGAKLGSATDAVARAAGVRTESAGTLMALAAPIALHVLGRQRMMAGGGAAALSTILGEQRSFLGSLLPAGLASLLGWTGLTAGLAGVGSAAAAAAGGAAQSARQAVADVGAGAAAAAGRVAAPLAQVPSKGSDWGIPLAAVAALILVALAYLWGAVPGREAMRQVSVRMAELQLPGGARISVPEGAFNFTLASWLGGTADAAVPRRFIFDNLNFQTGSTALTPESRPTVDSLVAILQAYPTVVVVLEGHTDSTGDAAANQKLSLDRAGAVKDLLVKGGVADPRIGTGGFGSAKPVASNDTEEGRAKNRRIELVVEKR